MNGSMIVDVNAFRMMSWVVTLQHGPEGLLTLVNVVVDGGGGKSGIAGVATLAHSHNVYQIALYAASFSFDRKDQ